MNELVILSGAVATWGVFKLIDWWFSSDQRARRAMRAVPRVDIADVVDGQKARIVGTVEADRTISAPLSGRPCVYWRVTVQETRDIRRGDRWATIIDQHEGVPFLLRDGSGKSWVRSHFAQAVLARDRKFYSGLLRAAPPALEAFLLAHGHSSKGAVLNKKLRFHEGVVQPGETVCAVGVGCWERDPDEKASAGAGYRETQMPRRLLLQSPEDGPLLLSDEPAMIR